LNYKGFVAYPFNISSHKPVFIKADEIRCNEEFSYLPERTNNDSCTFNKNDYLHTAEIFLKAVNSDFEKLVLSRIKRINSNNGNIFELFKVLCQLYPNAFVFLFNHPETGCWIGASPEILLSRSEENTKTLAMAGTQIVRQDKHIYWQDKEIQEQASVMNYLENILNRRSILYQKNGPFNKIAAQFGTENLIHLATEYSFGLYKEIFDLLIELHPTPAVCGLPEKEAFKFIVNNEKHDRKYYSGFIGPINILNEGAFHFFVNLRSMEVFNDEFILYVGGGLNNKSNSESEWLETENKAKTLENAINEYLIKTKPPIK
jgi:isochorismate synthase